MTRSREVSGEVLQFLKNAACRGRDDAAAEACLSLISRGHTVEVPALASLTNKRHRGHLRRKNCERKHAEAILARQPRSVSPDEVLESGELRSALAAAIASLPEDNRVPFVQRYLLDRPVREISAELGTPLRTIRSRIERASRKLRRNPALAKLKGDV